MVKYCGLHYDNRLSDEIDYCLSDSYLMFHFNLKISSLSFGIESMKQILKEVVHIQSIRQITLRYKNFNIATLVVFFVGNREIFGVLFIEEKH